MSLPDTRANLRHVHNVNSRRWIFDSVYKRRYHLLQRDQTKTSRSLAAARRAFKNPIHRQKLAELEEEITCLPTTDEVWCFARNLARKCRATGATIPSADLVIASCALFHGVQIEYCDAHFDAILRIGVVP